MTLRLLFILSLLCPCLGLAQHCGQTVTGTLFLTADLHCAGPGPALQLAGASPRLLLNGFRIDMGNSGANAIEVSHAQQAVVSGPGVVSGAGIAVSVFRSQGVEVFNLTVEGSTDGVVATDSAQVAVTENRFRKLRGRAVFIGSVPGSAHSTSGALVLLNQLDAVGSGIHLCGEGTVDARVRHNTIRRVSGWGILIYDGASYARVHHNQILASGFQAAIEVRSGSFNLVHDNELTGNRQASGIVIATLVGQTCAVNSTAAADQNIVSRNSIRDFLRGAQVGYGNGRMANFNNVQGNLFDGNGIDLALERDSYVTDARGNDRGTRGAGGVVVNDNGTASLF